MMKRIVLLTLLASCFCVPLSIHPITALIRYYTPNEEQLGYDRASYSVDLIERARNNEPEALLYLSNLHYQGIVVEADHQLAASLLEKSAHLGYAPAKREYARRLIRGDICVPENTDEMCRLLHKAKLTDEEERLKAQAVVRQKDYAMKVLKSTGFVDDGWSAYYYGMWLSLFPFTGEEIAEGVALLQKAAEEGNSQAMMLLAQYCYEGRFVKKSPSQYFHWMKMAADRGYDRAKMAVARCHVLGFGTPKNMELGFRMCDELRAQNYPLADEFMQELKSAGIIKEIPFVRRKFVSEFPKWPNRDKLTRLLANIDPSKAMLCAAKDGDWKKVKEYLLFKGADVDAQDYVKKTALHYALEQKDFQATYNLLQYGANPNLYAMRAVRPLQLAKSAGKEFVSLLIDFGADPALSDGMSVILSYRDMELLKYCFGKYDLLSPQVFFNFMGVRDDRITDYYLSKIRDVNVKNRYGKSYMYVAGTARRMDIADKLMKMGFKNRGMYEAAKTHDEEMAKVDKWHKDNPVPPFTNRDYSKASKAVRKWIERSQELER